MTRYPPSFALNATASLLSPTVTPGLMLSASGTAWPVNWPLDLAEPAFTWLATNNLTVPVARMGKTSNMLGALATALFDQITEVVNDTFGVTGEAAAAVISVGARARINISDLAETLELSHSGAVRVVDRLVAEGLIQREQGKDSRAVALKLTTMGRKKRRIALKQRDRVLTAAIAHLSPEEEVLFARQLESILRNMLRTREQGFRICRLCEEDVCVSQHCPIEERWIELFERG